VRGGGRYVITVVSVGLLDGDVVVSCLGVASMMAYAALWLVLGPGLVGCEELRCKGASSVWGWRWLGKPGVGAAVPRGGKGAWVGGYGERMARQVVPRSRCWGT